MGVEEVCHSSRVQTPGLGYRALGHWSCRQVLSVHVIRCQQLGVKTPALGICFTSSASDITGLLHMGRGPLHHVKNVGRRKYAEMNLLCRQPPAMLGSLHY
jgi:hypothetical protein